MADAVLEAERLGFASVAVPDSPMMWRDTYAVLAVAAGRTERIMLTVAISNFGTRDPGSLASLGRTVAELAPGRFRLGIGAGDSAVTLSGGTRPSHSDLRRGLDTVAKLSAGQAVGAADGEMVLHDPVEFPILLAAEGPRNLVLAASVADGVITSHFDSARKHKVIVDTAQEHGRPTPSHIAVPFVCITDDLAKDAQIVKPFILRMAAASGTERFEKAGFPIRTPPTDIRLPDGTDLAHPRDLDAAISYSSTWVSDELAIWFATTACLFGSPSVVVERLRQLAAEGVDEVFLHGGKAFELPLELMSAVARDVLPAFQPEVAPAS